jgi:hypothetical protein
MVETLGVEGDKRGLEFAVHALDDVVGDVAFALEIAGEAGGQRGVNHHCCNVGVSVGAKEGKCLATIGGDVVGAIHDQRQPARLRDQFIDAISDL